MVARRLLHPSIADYVIQLMWICVRVVRVLWVSKSIAQLLTLYPPWSSWGMLLSAVRRTASPSTPVKRLISVRVNLCYDLVNHPLDCINSSFPICLRSRYYMAHRKPRKLATTTFSSTLNWLEGGNIFMILKVCRPSLALGGWFFSIPNSLYSPPCQTWQTWRVQEGCVSLSIAPYECFYSHFACL